MPRVKSAVLLVLPLVILAGCSALFDFNLYKDLGLDPVAAPRASDYAGAGGLDKLAADLGSAAIIDALAADGAAKAALVTFLQGQITVPVDTPAEQQASILLADLELKTTSGEEFVNNIVTVALGGVTGTIQDLLNSTIPAEAKADPATYAAMVNALLAANDAYLALGAGIADTNGTPGIQPGEGVPPGTNMGDVAQKAIIAFTTKVLFETVKTTGGFTDSQTLTQMYLLSTNPAAADASVQGLAAPDPFDPASPDLYIQANLPIIENIIDCAGLPLPGAP